MVVIKRAAPRQRCKNRSKRTGAQCVRPVKPGRAHCEQHCAKFAGNTPESEARRIAPLASSRGGDGSNQHTARRFVGDPEAIATRAVELEAQVPIRDEQGAVPAAMRRLTKTAGKIDAELDWIAAKANLTQRDERRRELLERRLDGYLDRLGLSAKALMDYEPQRLKREAMASHRAAPSRDDVHSKKVFAILMASGAIGPVAAAMAQEHTAEGDNPELVLFTAEERRAMSPPVPTENAEPVAYAPEQVQLALVRDGVGAEALQ